MPLDSALRNLVQSRASYCCEYCHLHQNQLPYIRFHIEHIIARQHGGTDDPANLALCCHWCNQHKGTNLATQVDNTLTPLFHPRKHIWEEHFQINDSIISGRTAIGTGTVRLLNMNDEERVQLRRS